MAHWLMKSEPDVFSYTDLENKPVEEWHGVRNFTARNNMKQMKVGELSFFYHSNIGKEIVGIVRISKPGLTDPSDPDGKWAAVKVRPVRKLKRPVTLAEIKATPALAEMELLRLSRLSVSAVRPAEWELVEAMAKRKAPGTA